MNNLEHLTEIQISAYSEGKLSSDEQQFVGKHLLFCNECRESLPIPTSDRIHSVIFTENKLVLLETKSATENPISFFFPNLSEIRRVFSQPITLAISSGAFVLLFGTLFTIWMISAPPVDNLAKQSLEEVILPSPIVNAPKPLSNVQNDTAEKAIKSGNEHRPEKSANYPQQKAKVDAPSEKAQKVIPANANATINKKPARTSEVRGNSGSCREEQLFESELYLKDANIVFTWKKIPNAKSYHLYLSDDNEILIDEFETENETSYVSKKTLDPSKSYKWKIIATLENGQLVVGPSLKVTSKDLQKNRMRLEKSKTNQVRCLIVKNRYNSGK